jgi:TPR repeat protein
MKGFSQDQLKAKIEYQEAETAYAEERYEEAIQKSETAETLLGKWAPNISYLKITAIDKLCDYENPKDKYLMQLAKEVDAYMQFCNANEDKVIEDKFKIVYNIQKILNSQKETEALKTMPEYLTGYNAANKSDYTTAADAYLKAAEKNNHVAMWRLGLLHYFGMKGVKNYPEAMSWFKKAAAKGNVKAMEYIGNMYYHGYGGSEDYSQAAQWYTKAVSAGSTEALNALGRLYNYGGVNLTKNETEALAWYTKASVKGNAAAMYNIGLLYERGTGVPKSNEEAFAWFKKSADHGYYYGMDKVSKCYQEGIGVTKNLDLAIEYIQKAIDANK